MDTMTKAVYEVMCKYRKYFTKAGVEGNLDKWREKKASLISLLSGHPNWDDEAMAIIFDVSESRDIDRAVVRQHRERLLSLAGSLEGLSQNQYNAFQAALWAATDEYSKTPSQDYIDIVKEKGGIKCVIGQKSSRIINKLCVKFGVNKHEEYNAVFAQLSDSLNPLEIKKTALLSVHPCDYLEMSNRDNSWDSCHCLADGGYQSGTLSYMNDGASMIFYTVDENITPDYRKAPKRTRQVFCYQDGALLQSRLYPTTDDDVAREQYRNLVQAAIAVCLNVPNLWRLKTEKNDVDLYYSTTYGSLHYQDYVYSGYRANVSLLRDRTSENRIEIGSRAICVCCGSDSIRGGNIKCDDCDRTVVCLGCESEVRWNDALYLDELSYCHSCVHVCASCGGYTREALFPVFDRNGNEIHVCESCYQRVIQACDECGIRSICSEIACNRYCQRTAVAAVAA